MVMVKLKRTLGGEGHSIKIKFVTVRHHKARAEDFGNLTAAFYKLAVYILHFILTVEWHVSLMHRKPVGFDYPKRILCPLFPAVLYKAWSIVKPLEARACDKLDRSLNFNFS